MTKKITSSGLPEEYRQKIIQSYQQVDGPHGIDFDKMLMEKHGIPKLVAGKGPNKELKAKGRKLSEKHRHGVMELHKVEQEKASEKTTQEVTKNSWSRIPMCSICKYPAAVSHTTEQHTKNYCLQCAGARLLQEELLKK